MDQEDLANLTANNTFAFEADFQSPLELYMKIFLECFTAISILSLIANVFVCATILKFPKLRRESRNIIIVNWKILDSVYLVLAPSTYRLISELFHWEPMRVVFCLLDEFASALLFSIFLLMSLSLADWYLFNYNKARHDKFKKIYKFLIAIVYVYIAVDFATATRYCLVGYFFNLMYVVIFFSYWSLLIAIIVFDVIHACKKSVLINKSENIGLILNNVTVFMWLPSFSVFVVNILLPTNELLLVGLILTAISFGNSIVHLVVLCKIDGGFNVFFKQIVKCRCDNQYENQDLDQIVTYNNDVDNQDEGRVVI